MEQVRNFRAEPASVRAARAFVGEALAGSDADLDVIRLLTSELATNAVLHAESAFLVRVIANPDVVRVEVINSEPELLLAMREPTETGGRGLPLVEELSSGWGAESRRAEKVVWFEVPASVVVDESQPARG